MLHCNKVFVYLPSRIPCGGSELAHQLVDYLREHNKVAYIVYGCDLNSGIKNPIMDCYAKYNVCTEILIDDNPHNVLVLPETAFDMAKRYRNIQIACWWMSVDNFVQHELHYHKYRWNTNKTVYQNIRKWIHVMLYHLPIPSFDILYFLRKEQERVIHLYQSFYACDYIKKSNLKRSYPLSDYINMELIPTCDIDANKKENIILYNPRKGLDFTLRIIASMPNYTFVALSGFDRKKLNNYFDKAKLYIDFGHFPGKDRLPREAVMHNCCIITSKNGAAAYYNDVPIDDKYKFDTSNSTIPSIVEMIDTVMNNYSDHIKNFFGYKNIVQHERDIFYKEIEYLFVK